MYSKIRLLCVLQLTVWCIHKTLIVAYTKTDKNAKHRVEYATSGVMHSVSPPPPPHPII